MAWRSGPKLARLWLFGAVVALLITACSTTHRVNFIVYDDGRSCAVVDGKRWTLEHIPRTTQPSSRNISGLLTMRGNSGDFQPDGSDERVAATQTSSPSPDAPQVCLA